MIKLRKPKNCHKIMLDLVLKIVIIVCLIVHIGHGLEKIMSREWTKCIDPGTQYSSSSGLTFQQCVTECVNRLNCKTLSYKIQEHLCMFLPMDLLYDTNKNGGGPCISVRRETILNAPMDADSSPCQCSDMEICDPGTGICIRNECSPFTISNGNFIGNMNNIGARVIFSCNSGFNEVREKQNASCLTNGVWSYIPQCIVVVDCHDGFVKYSESCYLITNDKPMNWQEAGEYCQGLGAHLVHVDNDIESARLALQCSSADANLYGYWMNLSDISTEDVWVWADTNTEAVYTNWGGEEPNSYENTEEDCGLLIRFFDYKWADVPCDFNAETICEMALPHS